MSPSLICSLRFRVEDASCGANVRESIAAGKVCCKEGAASHVAQPGAGCSIWSQGFMLLVSGAGLQGACASSPPPPPLFRPSLPLPLAFSVLTPLSRYPSLPHADSNFGFRISGSRFRVSDFEFRVLDSEFRAEDLLERTRSGWPFRRRRTFQKRTCFTPHVTSDPNLIRVSGCGIRVSDFGFRDSGEGCKVSVESTEAHVLHPARH
jgi:hypothetical protein